MCVLVCSMFFVLPKLMHKQSRYNTDNRSNCHLVQELLNKWKSCTTGSGNRATRYIGAVPFRMHFDLEE